MLTILVRLAVEAQQVLTAGLESDAHVAFAMALAGAIVFAQRLQPQAVGLDRGESAYLLIGAGCSDVLRPALPITGQTRPSPAKTSFCALTGIPLPPDDE
jgi:hypothetical protein